MSDLSRREKWYVAFTVFMFIALIVWAALLTHWIRSLG